MIRSVIVLISVSTLTSGCINVSSVRSRIPFAYHDQAATDYSAPYKRNARQQYFDKFHKRYYFYDPVRKAYFWENGQPKS